MGKGMNKPMPKVRLVWNEGNYPNVAIWLVGVWGLYVAWRWGSTGYSWWWMTGYGVGYKRREVKR